MNILARATRVHLNTLVIHCSFLLIAEKNVLSDSRKKMLRNKVVALFLLPKLMKTKLLHKKVFIVYCVFVSFVPKKNYKNIILLL